jgi:para-nitrobenzyl esterase
MAASGNPNNPRTPAWAPYDQKSRNTMVFGSPSNVVSDPRKAFREVRAKSSANSDD